METMAKLSITDHADTSGTIRGMHTARDEESGSHGQETQAVLNGKRSITVVWFRSENVFLDIYSQCKIRSTMVLFILPFLLPTENIFQCKPVCKHMKYLKK